MNDLETFQDSKHDIICSNGEGKAPLLAFFHGLSSRDALCGGQLLQNNPKRPANTKKMHNHLE